MKAATGWMGRLARVFVEDPLRKLLATAVAVLVWLYLNAQIITRTELSMRLVPPPSEGKPLLPTTQRLLIRLQPHEHRVLGFADAATGLSIDGVTFAVSGPQSLVALLANEEPFVEPTEAELRAGDGAFVFTLERVSTRDPTLRQFLRHMQPRSVRVRTDRLESQRVRLLPSMIARPQPAERRTIFERIDFEEARFYPEEITFRGSRGSLDKLASASADQRLLDFATDAAPPASGSEWHATLRINPILADGLELLEPEVQVRFPLHPQFATFEIEVPVLLDLTALEGVDAAGTALVVEPPLAKIALAVSGQLESELRQKNPDELRQWAKRTARLLAAPPAGRPPSTPVTVLAQLILYDPAYREGRDYALRTPPPVVITPRK